MEATQAGLIINNSSTVITPVNIAFAGGGAVGSFLLLVSQGFLKEFFDKRAQARTKKLEAAKDLNSFVIEGMHKGFRIRAGSEQHILFRATEIEAIDSDVGIKLRQFLNSWSQYRNFLKDNPLEIESEKMAIGFKNDAQKIGEELLKIAKKWAK